MGTEGQGSGQPPKGQSSGQPPKGQGSGQPPKPPVCIPLAGEKVLQEFQILVQKVGGRPEVLLIGETLEGKDIHGMMSKFVQDLFSATCHPVHPADALKEPCTATCSLGGRQCQLIFFLCRASCLQGKRTELRKVLKEVKKFVQRSPCALVGVIMDPTKGEAEAARNQMLRMLQSVFPKPVNKRGKQAAGSKGGTSLELEDIEVEAEVYIPGETRGNLAIMKAACRASEALAKGLSEPGVAKDPLTVSGSSWTWFFVKGLLGTALVVGMASGVGWYLYEQGLLPPDLIPTAFFSFA
ncbi:uncharacterized protein C2orf72-like [Tiliqua scincoides]|uniref:uncharacterized protein C2orf72-like n=1 Tax=Tiliqua scincoides TaxID=71010 RepID=UPI003461A77E